MRLQDKIGPQKVRMPSRHNLLDDVTALRIRLGRDQRADREATQGVTDGKRASAESFRPAKGIDDAGALVHGVIYKGLHSRGLTKFRHRSELHALIPGQADREGIDRLTQLFEEGVHD